MKISRLGTALTLAALAATGARSASAQVDMTGAAGALSSIRALKAQAAQAPKPGPKKGVPPPTADDAAWQKIVAAVKAKGKYIPEQPPIKPGSFNLEDVSGDPKADHTVEKAAALGALNEDGLFETLGFVFGSQTWKLAAGGNWNLDSWIFETDVYGELASVAHIVAVLDPARELVSGGPDRLTTSDPRIAPKYKAVIDHWSAPRP